MRNNILINKKGKIVAGDSVGLNVLIQPESNGYLILVFNEPEKKSTEQGYDYWVENLTELNKLFNEANWKVDWI